MTVREPLRRFWAYASWWLWLLPVNQQAAGNRQPERTDTT
jgi:hypothetical protein